MTIRVEPATVGDRAAMIDVLTAAFHNDPPMTSLIPDESRRPAALRRFFSMDVTPRALETGQSVVAHHGDRVVGAALAFPAGWRRPSRFVELVNMPRYMGIFRSRVLQAQDLGQRLHASHPKEPHIHLLYIGAAEPGHGAGAAMLTALGEDADMQGVPMYLEATTPNSARLYARHGFEAVDELRHPVADFTLMLRPAGGG